jgi:hypothetical protein
VRRRENGEGFVERLHRGRCGLRLAPAAAGLSPRTLSTTLVDVVPLRVRSGISWCR